MSHSLATNPAMGNLDPATVTNHAFVFHATVFAAGTFPVLFGTKNPLAEQTVLFRTISTIVNRLGLLHLTIGPGGPNVGGIGQSDADRANVIDAVVIHIGGAHHLPLCIP